MAIDIIGNLKVPFPQPLVLGGQILGLENILKKIKTIRVIEGNPCY